MADLVTGTVKFFLSKKSYGFATPSAGGQDIFFHKSMLDKGPCAGRIPREGDVMKGDVEVRKDGPMFVRVHELTSAEAKAA